MISQKTGNEIVYDKKKLFAFSAKMALSHEIISTYRKIASSNTSCLEAHAGFFRLLMKGIFGPYVQGLI